MNAAALIKLLRKHGTLTLAVCLVFVSLVTGYMAIELGSSSSSTSSQPA